MTEEPETARCEAIEHTICTSVADGVEDRKERREGMLLVKA